MLCGGIVEGPLQPPERGALSSEGNQGDEWDAYVTLDAYDRDERGINPLGRESRGDGVLVVVVGATTHQGGRESRPQGDMSRATYRPPCCAKKYVALVMDRARGRRAGWAARLLAARERNIFRPA